MKWKDIVDSARMSLFFVFLFGGSILVTYGLGAGLLENLRMLWWTVLGVGLWMFSYILGDKKYGCK